MATIAYCPDVIEHGKSRLEQLSLKALLSALPVARLAGINFMGLLGLRPIRTTDQSRFHHSVAVAGLAVRILETTAMPEEILRHVAAAALLHDASQWALSHSCEGAFAALTGFNNGQIIQAMIFDKSNLPRKYHVGELLDSLSIDRKKVWMLLDRKHQQDAREMAHCAGWVMALNLFACPMHPDTIDGIVRACLTFGIDCPSREEMADCFEYRAGALFIKRDSLHLLDAFWKAKEAVYRDKIHSTASLLAELQYSLAVFDHFRDISLGDALDLDDDAVLRAVEPCLPEITSKTAVQGYNLRFRKPKQYFIDQSVLTGNEPIPIFDLRHRYRAALSAQISRPMPPQLFSV